MGSILKGTGRQTQDVDIAVQVDMSQLKTSLMTLRVLLYERDGLPWLARAMYSA